jgi:hypothetical protein
MKRSRSLVLTSMMAGGGLALQACDNARPRRQWATPPAAGGSRPAIRSSPAVQHCRPCEAAGMSKAQCETAYQQALRRQRGQCSPISPTSSPARSATASISACRAIRRRRQLLHATAHAVFIIGQALNGRLRRGAATTGTGTVTTACRTADGWRDYCHRPHPVGLDAFGPPATRQAPARVQSRSGVVSRGGFAEAAAATADARTTDTASPQRLARANR